MTVKRGSVYDDKQHMLDCASWCNDVVMPDSLTSAHCLWWPFMTALIDSRMHQNRNDQNENAVGRRPPICHQTGGGKERWHLSLATSTRTCTHTQQLAVDVSALMIAVIVVIIRRYRSRYFAPVIKYFRFQLPRCCKNEGMWLWLFISRKFKSGRSRSYIFTFDTLFQPWTSTDTDINPISSRYRCYILAWLIL